MRMSGSMAMSGSVMSLRCLGGLAPVMICLMIAGAPLGGQEIEWLRKTSPVLRLIGAHGILGQRVDGLSLQRRLTGLPGGFTFDFGIDGLAQVGIEPVPIEVGAAPADSARVVRLLVEVPTGDLDPARMFAIINTHLGEPPTCYETRREDVRERSARWQSKVLFIVRHRIRDDAELPHSIGLGAGLFSPPTTGPVDCGFWTADTPRPETTTVGCWLSNRSDLDTFRLGVSSDDGRYEFFPAPLPGAPGHADWSPLPVADSLEILYGWGGFTGETIRAAVRGDSLVGIAQPFTDEADAYPQPVAFLATRTECTGRFVPISPA